MSYQAVGWVLANSKSKGTTRAVALAIAYHAHADGTDAWPSHATLAREANTSESSVKRSITWLIENGELRKAVKAGGLRQMRADLRPNVYRFAGMCQTARNE